MEYIYLSKDKLSCAGMYSVNYCEKIFDQNCIGYKFQYNCYSVEERFIDCLIHVTIINVIRSISYRSFTMTLHQNPKIFHWIGNGHFTL